ncbi:MAG: hypothetical protein HOK37_07205, partial [Gammaproteobacteria bacterium]|nr:hypothetical protein [Gammaproteobacteria bacterium]
MTTEITRILVIDDHPLLREGVCSTLDSVDDFEVVGQGGSFSDAIKMAHELVPDTICPKAQGVEFHNDHIWPKKLGGLTDWRNRKVLCAFCNKLKSYNPSFWG